MKDLPVSLEKAKYKKYVPIKRDGKVFQQLRTVGTDATEDTSIVDTNRATDIFETEKEFLSKYTFPLTNEKELEEVINAYEIYVKKHVSRFIMLRKLSPDMRDDLTQEGIIGAYQAIKTFNPDKGQNLTARINVYVQNALQEHMALAAGKHTYEAQEQRRIAAVLGENPNASIEEISRISNVSIPKVEVFLNEQFKSPVEIENVMTHPFMEQANNASVDEIDVNNFFQTFETTLKEPEKNLFHDIIGYEEGEIVFKTSIAELRKKYNTNKSVMAERVSKIAVKLLDQLPEETLNYYMEVEPKEKPKEKTFIYMLGRSIGVTTLEKKYQRYTLHKSFTPDTQVHIVVVILGLLVRLLERSRLEDSLKRSLATLSKSLQSLSEIEHSLGDKNIQLKSATVSTLPFLVKQAEPYGQIPKSFKPIRIKQRKSDLFKTFKVLPLKESVNVVLGSYKKSNNVYQIQSLEFNTNPTTGDVWDLPKAKEFEKTNKSYLKSFKVVF